MEDIQIIKPWQKILIQHLPPEEKIRSEVFSFINEFPKLPNDAKEAFGAIRKILVDQGFAYDHKTFTIEEVISKKRGNCLGLSLLFGAILAEQGFDVNYEIVVNPQDAHYKNDILQFDRAIHGELFSYDNLPDLPNQKVEMPQGWFTPLEHPVLIIGGQSYETTSLIDDSNTENKHDYKSESQRSVTYENLIGSSLVAKAKTALEENDSQGLDSLIETTKAGLNLWPNDSQGQLLLRNLALHNFDDKSFDEATTNFIGLKSDDSLFNFSMFEITGDESFLDRALEKYPAFIAAFLRKKIKLPLTTEGDKLEAKFNFTVASICIANSSEIDLASFYLSNINILIDLFGPAYTADLLYDLEIDETNPIDYCLAMWQIKNDPGFLIEAVKKGVLENSTPLDCLNFCKLVLKNKDLLETELVDLCSQKIEGIKNKFAGSKLLEKELQK